MKVFCLASAKNILVFLFQYYVLFHYDENERGISGARLCSDTGSEIQTSCILLECNFFFIYNGSLPRRPYPLASWFYHSILGEKIFMKKSWKMS